MNPAPAEATQRRGRALVVEDEPDVAELIRHHLVKEGWDVLTASSGPAALRRAHDLCPDLVLLDLMLPGLNGWEVCRRLRQDPEARAILIIMVTGRVEEGDVIRTQVFVKAGDLEIDRDRFEMRVKGCPVDLALKEFELLDVVWGQNGFVQPHTVDVHLARLRAKFVATKLPMPTIETVRGVGDRFRDQNGNGSTG